MRRSPPSRTEMEEWKRRYVHERDMRDSQLESLGLPPIKDDKFGTLTVAPESVWRRFNGPKFWPLMKEKGHTSCRFESCECRK